MIGIVLVTKPPFLFPPSKPINETTTDLIHDYLDRNYVLYDLKVVNWTDMSIPTHFEYLTESAGDYYFIGAIIALSSAIFSASNNIVIAKLVRKVTLFRRLKPIRHQSPSNFNLETCFEFIRTLDKNIYFETLWWIFDSQFIFSDKHVDGIWGELWRKYLLRTILYCFEKKPFVQNHFQNPCRGSKLSFCQFLRKGLDCLSC